MTKILERLGALGLGLAFAGSVVGSALYNVNGGHRAVIFDRFTGIKKNVSNEGTHFLIPWVQKPIFFDIRSRPRSVTVMTGSKGMSIWFIMPCVFTFWVDHTQ
jgi:prohibitin 1